MYNTARNDIYKGDIWMVDLSKHEVETVQGGIRPCIIFSNFYNNKYSPNVNIIPLTSSTTKNQIPVHVNIGLDCGVTRPSIALVEQSTVIPKSFLMHQVGRCTDAAIHGIERALKIQHEIPVDLTLVNSLVNFINEIDKFILQYRPGDIQDLLNSRSLRVAELRKYCYENFVDFNRCVGKRILDISELLNMFYQKEGVGVAQ